jgi:hypothetical protein
MRKSFVALLLIIGAAALANLAYAAVESSDLSGDFNGKVMNAQMAKELRSRAARVGTSSHSPAINDTTYVGFNPAYAGSNYWSVGVGYRHPTGFPGPNPTNANRGYWDWDQPVNGDSLQGWWPVRHQYTGTGGLTLPDTDRPWWAIDIGNQISYVINQGNPYRRTFGVTSAWHSDAGLSAKTVDTDPGKGDVNPKPPRWTPLAGSRSAWCGLRGHGDVTVVDPITGNPYNVDALEHVSGGGTGPTGTNRRFPGYASQWDQMLYRDIDISGASPDSVVKIYFRLRTRMSTGKGTADATRTGWFDKDPLAVTADNFISSTNAGVDAPLDSFMVYVGCPVADTVGAEWTGSDLLTHEVFDPVRRWFGELVRANEAGGHYEVYTTFGNTPPETTTADSNAYVDVCAMRDVTYGSLQSTWGNKLRLVFRIKTNRGFDDNDATVTGQYRSGYLGAAQVDSVSVDLGSGGVSIGDFENQSDINNDAGTTALQAWKTSSKPPAIYHHFHSLASLLYQDLCGPPGSVNRICNMFGGVISVGDHDNSEAANGEQGTAEQEWYEGIYSPTINLSFASVGVNNMGLDAAHAQPTEDFYIAYESYTGIYDIFNLGNGWQFFFQSYPATQADGTRMWGEFRLPPFQYFNPDKQCFDNLDAARAWGAIRTSNAGLQPDSIRIGLRKLDQCYRFGITTDCGATDGGYWDNVALAIIDGAIAPITVDIWEWFNDTFPFNEDLGLPGLVAFDTTTALIKTGRNSAQTTNSLLRYDVPSDSTLITAEGDSVEVQLVFRILPGPGNYVTAGDPSTGLRKVPTDPTAISSSDSTFWTLYILDNGKVPDGHGTGGPFAARWNSLAWNSVRCDTAEANIFPVAARNLNNSILTGTFASMIHEDDPKYNLLGLDRHRCFLIDTLGPINNITCNSLPDWVVTVPNTRTGYAGGGDSLTKEGTKAIPDGLLTPGSHVQYFYIRKDLDTGLSFDVPDSNTVSPQGGEGPSLDGHRWQEFSVLPDAWKFGRYGGLGQACMLYVDWNDRRGNERVWVSVADSIGATSSAKYGAHNGWHAENGVSVNDAAGFVYNLNAQPGTTWDMYGIKASESLNTAAGSLGARFAYRGTPSLLDNQWARNAPTIAMLEAYYRVMLILTGDLNSAILGPFPDKSQDDERIITEFLLGATSEDHRGIMIEGDGFVQDSDDAGLALLGLLGVALRHPNYIQLSGNTNVCADLVTTANITSNGDLYGMRNACTYTLDVLDLDGDGVAATYYDPVGANPLLAPYISGVFKDAIAPNYWQALTDGWNIFNQRSRFCGQTYGRLAYFYNVFTVTFQKFCDIAGTGGVTTEVPQNPEGKTFVDFATIGNNPLRQGEASINLTLAKTDRVEVKIYDVSGRLIRTLADGQLFKAGPQKLTWDGLDNGGRQVARGVYFTHIKFANSRFENNTKMVVLK